MRAHFVALLVGFALAGSASAQTPVQSFDQLQAILEPGQKIIVVDEGGAKRRGELISMTADDVAVKWRGTFYRVRQRSFSEDMVRRIDIVDSVWEGALIGCGAGLLLTAVGIHSVDAGYYLVLLSLPMGCGIGVAIDNATNRAVYMSPGTPPQVRLSPVLGPNRLGLAATFRF